MQYPERPTSDKDATFRVAYIGNKPTFYFKNYDVLIFLSILAKKKLCTFFHFQKKAAL